MGTQLVRVEQAAIADQFMPAMNIAQAVQRRQAIVDAAQQLMKQDTDYGVIPGTPKPTLLKPGAEKLCTLFGLSPAFILESSDEDWTGERHGGESFFNYRYKCQLARNGNVMGEGDGSCNSWESKYRYRWVVEGEVPAGMAKDRLRNRDGSMSEFAFAIDKAETGGKYGKPTEYWQQFKDAIASGEARKVQRETKSGKKMDAWEIGTTVYRVPNPDVCDQVNTIQKMAQKRALIAATLIAINASEFYTQDLDDMQDPILEPHDALGHKTHEAKQAEEPPPPAPFHAEDEDLPPELRGRASEHPQTNGKPWKTFKEMITCFSRIHSALNASGGSDADYYGELDLAGVKHANEFKAGDGDKALACYQALEKRLAIIMQGGRGDAA